MVKTNVVYLHRDDETDAVLRALRELYPNANCIDFGMVAVRVARWVHEGWPIMRIMDDAMAQLVDLAWKRRELFENIANAARLRAYKQRRSQHGLR